MKKKALWKQYLVLAVVCAALVVLDQLVKNWTLQELAGQPSLEWIPGVFQLTYAENRGAAFGIFQGNSLFLGIFSIVIAALLAYLYKNVPEERRYRILRICLILIIAGALGNQLDRFFRGYVVDMFDFCLIHFAIFNVADCYVTVGGIALILFAICRPETLDLLLRVRRKKEAD